MTIVYIGVWKIPLWKFDFLWKARNEQSYEMNLTVWKPQRFESASTTFGCQENRSFQEVEEKILNTFELSQYLQIYNCFTEEDDVNQKGDEAIIERLKIQ